MEGLGWDVYFAKALITSKETSPPVPPLLNSVPAWIGRLEIHHVLHWFDAHGPDGQCEHQFLIRASQQAVKSSSRLIGSYGDILQFSLITYLVPKVLLLSYAC